VKFTNKLGLPDAIVRAVKNDKYSKGDADYSATQLLKPPRAVVLEREHWEHLEQDVSDRVWSMFGQAFHVVAERANHEDVAERRLSITINGVKVSGGMDLFQEGSGTYVDYKTTNMWALKNSGPKEWERQFNIYAAILRANGIEVKKAKAMILIKDWRSYELRQAKERGKPYPESSILMMDIPLWEPEKALNFLKTRIALHEAAKKILPDCDEEERWNGNRCVKYCPAAAKCEQFQKLSKPAPAKSAEIFKLRRSKK